VLAGGTMLYFAALQRGLSRLPGADAGVREQRALRAREIGWTALHGELAAVDPAAAQHIHPNDPQRIQRALEVWHLTGVPLSEHHRADPQSLHGLRAVKVVLSPPQREQLHARIAQRFDAMLEAGLVDEVAALRGDPRVTADTPAMRAVGYRQVWNYLAGDWSYSEMRERAIISSRQLAKRQLTWLRRESDVRWFTFDGSRCRPIHDYIDAAVG
jgi:tRNA dimethylallyltransferase